MNDREEEVRSLIARQAADWFVAQRDGSIGPRERKAFDEWLLASPAHVDEYLGVTAVALALPTAADDPEFSIDAVLERARLADDADVRRLREDMPRPRTPGLRAVPQRPPFWTHWQFATAALLAVVIGASAWWNLNRVVPQRYATTHGEQRSWALTDRSVVRLNTDSAVTVRYGRSERLVELSQGQAYFEVAHEPARRFRVSAGVTNIVAVGTQFDVHKDRDLTVVTVIEGRVMVSSLNDPYRQLPVGAGEQVRVLNGVVPEHATATDAQRSVAWLQGQIAFDQEPLATVVAEFNRYGTLPIDIETPSLENLHISGVFNIGDTDTFVAFLRTLDDVTVARTPAAIHVFTLRQRDEAKAGVSSDSGK